MNNEGVWFALIRRIFRCIGTTRISTFRAVTVLSFIQALIQKTAWWHAAQAPALCERYHNPTLSYVSLVVFLKMELHWKSNPIGKVCNNLPFFQELEYKKFTQKTWLYQITRNMVFNSACTIKMNAPDSYQLISVSIPKADSRPGLDRNLFFRY